MSDELQILKAELAELASTMKKSHLAIAKGLAQGKSQEKAYVDAGSKSKKPAVDASKTISNYPSILQYKNLFLKIAELESLPKEIATFEQKKELLWTIANKAATLKMTVKGSEGEDGEGGLEVFDATAAKTAVSAVAELNKMDGHLAALKLESKTSHIFEQLTEEQLDDRIAELLRKAGIGISS